jgi:Transglutaminase-like superfamily
MSFLVLRAYMQLIVFDLDLKQRSFRDLYEKVRNSPMGTALHNAPTVEQVCYAMDLACIWYWKEVLCLQRSAATTSLLKQSGIAAQMVIGAQQLPFKAHAWVEVDGRVVNDKPYMPEIYGVLDRC